MFKDFYDSVKYEKKLKRDKSGYEVYAEPIKIDARYLKGYDEIKMTSTGSGSVFNRVYHVPFEVYEGDKIDGRLVKKVTPCRGVFGKIHFWKVGVQ